LSASLANKIFVKPTSWWYLYRLFITFFNSQW
jgi:hypothetical protein